MGQEPDFSKIQDVSVGYQLRADDANSPKRLERITFGQFIPPHAHRTETPQQVYINLQQALVFELEQQSSVIDGRRPIMLDVLATATLRRESILHAMALIRRDYL